MAELLVVGNGLAGLIVALAQARRGRSVCLLADGRAPGGHFAGIDVDGLRFDIGMVLLEQHRPAEPGAALASYRPAVRNDWTRFGQLASDWLNAELRLQRCPTPECLVAGRTGPDFLIANRLDLLASLGLPAPPPLSRDDPRHAAHKLAPGPYDTLDYAGAAALNHGAALHAACIEPFVRKLTGGGSETFLARQHRAAWVPLYHPQTLAAAVKGEPTGLPEYPFWTTASGCVADAVHRLTEALCRLPGAQLVTEPLDALAHASGGWTARTRDGTTWQAPRAVLALGQERCAGLLGLPTHRPGPAASVGVWLCSLPQACADAVPACRMVVDEQWATYRLCSPDRLAGLDPPRLRLAVEANPEVLARRHPGQAPDEAIRGEVAELLGLADPAVLQIHRRLIAPNALALPTAAALAAGAGQAALLADHAPQAWPTGTLLGHGVASINDQIVQALQITEALAG